jgi:bifunctional non-homologous end joining protein LigD
MPPSKFHAKFIEPMLLQRTDNLPQGDTWLYEIKLDGYRAVAFKSGGKVHLRSRNDKDFTGKYPAIVAALAAMPDATVIDGEIVALENGRPSLNALQNYNSASGPLYFYVFDVMMLAGKEVTGQPLERRRELLRRQVLARLDDPVRESPELVAWLPVLIQSVRAQGLEGLVAHAGRSCCGLGQRGKGLRRHKEYLSHREALWPHTQAVWGHTA